MAPKTKNAQKFIYIADDDRDDRELFIEAIREVDSSIVLREAHDGMELMNILEQLSDSLPDVLFLDINMPGKGGFECLEEIRHHNSKLRDMKVIMLSTSNDPDDIEKAVELGASFYAVKPSSFGILKNFVKDVLQIDWDIIGVNKKFRLI